MTKITLKTGNTWPYVEAVLSVGGALIPLAGATVEFAMYKRGATSPKLVKAATIVDAAASRVRYGWVAEDTDTVGEYLAEFIVTFADGAKTTIPNDQYIEITILKSLGT